MESKHEILSPCAGDGEEVVMKGKDIEDALVELGLKRGVLYFRDIEEGFPADHFPLKEVEHLLIRLDNLGVRVVENEGCLKVRHRHKRRAA